MKSIYDLLRYPDLKLLLARYRLLMEDAFEKGSDNLYGWEVTEAEGVEEGQSFHVMTNDTNQDQSSGLEGGIAISSMGAWKEGIAEKEITLQNYGEISFEHYVKNDPLEDGKARSPNILRFYIDNVKKLEIKGPSPWYRCEPFGLTPGKHMLKFEYVLPQDDKSPNARKGVVDTITVHEARDARSLITSYTPPRPVKASEKISILRGYSSFQQMKASDTKIEFTAAFEGIDFHDFMTHAGDIFYFVDEFGVCYRGLFDTDLEPNSIALSKQYLVELSMIAGQKTGVGFC